MPNIAEPEHCKEWLKQIVDGIGIAEVLDALSEICDGLAQKDDPNRPLGAPRPGGAYEDALEDLGFRLSEWSQQLEKLRGAQ